MTTSDFSGVHFSGVRVARLRDVAARAGVSIKTASRVVNGEAGVAPGTAMRVRRAVHTLGYVPNVAARRLVQRRAFVLGLVYQNRSWNWLNDFQAGAIAEARALGYEVLMHPCDPRDRRERELLLRTIDQGSVDGLVLTPPCADFEDLGRELGSRRFPAVGIAPSRRSGRRPSVSPGDREGASAMAEHLAGLGHRRIAFVAGGSEQRSSHDRETGFRDGLASHGVGLDPRLVLPGDFSFESGVTCGRVLLALDPRPTAVFACNDDMAAGILAACHEHGVAVPGEISVAGFDDVALARQVWPALTTVRQPTGAIAGLAVRLLVETLAGTPRAAGRRHPASRRHQTLATELVVRGSTGPPCTWASTSAPRP